MTTVILPDMMNIILHFLGSPYNDLISSLKTNWEYTIYHGCKGFPSLAPKYRIFYPNL